MRAKRTLFISYSHADTTWLERLQVALAPLIASHRLDAWDDQRIKPGAQWREEIETALSASNAAVLLVTQEFFASEFIRKKELPIILRMHKRNNLPVLWIPVSATNFELTPLKGLQAAHDPKRPLDSLSAASRKRAFVEIVRSISSEAATKALGDVLQTIDAITPAIHSVARSDPRWRSPKLVARPREGRVEFRSGGVVIDWIDPPDLRRLSEAERQLIITYQTSMAGAYARWRSLYPRRDALTTPERRRFRLAQRQMCGDLGKVVDFLDRIGKPLQDHYRTVRNECGDLRRRPR
jgi:TIR domain-containing protein